MIRLKHLSGSLQGRTAELAKPVLRIGRAPDCDVRFDQVNDPKVSNHHAELLLEEGNWFVVDTASTNGTLINGRRVTKHRLASGDKLQIGSGGPVLQVHFDGILIEEPSFKTEAILLQEISQPPRPIDDSEEISAISDHLKASADTQTARLAELAAKKVAMERAKTGGQSSGKTMFIMAETMRQVQFSTKAKTKKRWVQVAMDSETDGERLEQLEQRLAQLTGNAQKTIDDLGKADKSKAAEVANAGDQMDRDIRKILAKFDAKTYAVPPVFKERLQFHVDELLHAGNIKYIYRRKQKYWPMILKEFGALGLPEEMAFIAWAETQFDPTARSKAGAAGMWQLGADTARRYNLRVDAQGDARGLPLSGQPPRRVRRGFLHAGHGQLQPRRIRRTPRPAPDRQRARRVQEGAPRLLAPVPPEEAARGDARVRAQGDRRRHRLHERAEVRPRGDEGRE